jgi:hypothetical protein
MARYYWMICDHEMLDYYGISRVWSAEITNDVVE